MKTVFTETDKRRDILVGVYFAHFGFKDLLTMTMADKSKLFAQVVNDYKEFAISLDDMSDMAEMLWWSLSKKEKDTKFGELLMSGMELSFYERNVVWSKLDTTFLDYLNEVLSFKFEPSN